MFFHRYSTRFPVIFEAQIDSKHISIRYISPKLGCKQDVYSQNQRLKCCWEDVKSSKTKRPLHKPALLILTSHELFCSLCPVSLSCSDIMSKPYWTFPPQSYASWCRRNPFKTSTSVFDLTWNRFGDRIQSRQDVVIPDRQLECIFREYISPLSACIHAVQVSAYRMHIQTVRNVHIRCNGQKMQHDLMMEQVRLLAACGEAFRSATPHIRTRAWPHCSPLVFIVDVTVLAS